jgi:small subunit ribosomal protein S1
MAEERQDMEKMYEETFGNVKPGAIVKGKVLQIDEGHALIDIGFKSEGTVRLSEFKNPIEVGDEVSVALVYLENEDGTVVLSKERADELEHWANLLVKYHQGEIVDGRVVKRVKGGYIADIGVDAFLPASQVSLSGQNVSGQVLPLKIIKMTEAKKNVVVSHRAAIDIEKGKSRAELISEFEKGQTRKGKVKNITDFGAFIDLGGVDGLLHITDISHYRLRRFRGTGKGHRGSCSYL